MSGLGFIALMLGAGIVGLWILLYFIPVGLWFQAMVSGAPVSIIDLIFMRWRKVPPSLMVNARINAKKAGIEITTDELESHFLAGGHVQSVVNALISADAANMNLNFELATAIDLAGRDVSEAVLM